MARNFSLSNDTPNKTTLSCNLIERSTYLSVSVVINLNMALDLNEHHQSVLMMYMKFAKYMRSQILKQIQQPFQGMESRLFDDTYTKEEVKELVEGLEKIVMCDVESELISFAHNNVLMLIQLFKQAEKWYLSLKIDMSELENQHDLELVKALDSGENQFQLSVKPSKSNSSENEEDGRFALLKVQIKNLEEENEKLAKVIQDLEDVADLYKQEKNSLQEKLSNIQEEVRKYKSNLENTSAGKSSEETTEQMKAKLNEFECLISLKNENLEHNENTKNKLKTELKLTEEKVKRIEAQLQLTEMELEKKFSQTKAYGDMKSILMKKNNTIKELRQILLKYEPEIQIDEEIED